MEARDDSDKASVFCQASIGMCSWFLYLPKPRHFRSSPNAFCLQGTTVSFFQLVAFTIPGYEQPGPQPVHSLDLFFVKRVQEVEPARSRSPLRRVHSSGDQHVNLRLAKHIPLSSKRTFKINLQYVQVHDVLTPGTYRRQALSLSIRFQMIPSLSKFFFLAERFHLGPQLVP